MKAHLLRALLSACVVTGAGFGLGRAVELVPEGPARDWAERYALEPGRELAERVGDSRAVKKARKTAQKGVSAAAEKAEEALESHGIEADRVAALYTTGAWAGAGFVICLLLTLALGVSSAGSALALGFKVSLAFFFLQAALVFGGLALLRG
ncbi:MAG: hypothetical protein HYV15_00775 [Elusimicrobia bacterium]|nr:hypothetical protein [Elusimicrobiota bacterium]